MPESCSLLKTVVNHFLYKQNYYVDQDIGGASYMMEGSTGFVKETYKQWGACIGDRLYVFLVKMEGWDHIKSFEVNTSAAEVPKSGAIWLCICPSRFGANPSVLCSDYSDSEWHVCSVSVCGGSSHLVFRLQELMSKSFLASHIGYVLESFNPSSYETLCGIFNLDLFYLWVNI